MSWWWLSFADPERPEGEQFLGAALVSGGEAVPGDDGFIAACLASHALGINPGGEVKGVGPFPEDKLPPNHPRNKLMSLAEIQAFAAEASSS